MKKKLLILMSMIASFVMTFSVSTFPAYAAEEKSDSKIEYIEGNLDNPESYETQLFDLLSNPDVDEVRVIDTRLEYDDLSISTVEDDQEITPFSSRVTIYRHRITNIKNASDWTGSNVIATAKGEPGVTVSISQTKSVSRTYSTTASYDLSSTVSSAVGFSVTGSTSISISGSAKVPTTYNGKAVKTMSLNAKPIYKKKTFNIDRRKSVNGYLYGWVINWGSGSASNPYGVSFSKSYTYK